MLINMSIVDPAFRTALNFLALLSVSCGGAAAIAADPSTGAAILCVNAFSSSESRQQCGRLLLHTTWAYLWISPGWMRVQRRQVFLFRVIKIALINSWPVFYQRTVGDHKATHLIILYATLLFFSFMITHVGGGEWGN